jgi:hypothetical protein
MELELIANAVRQERETRFRHPSLLALFQRDRSERSLSTLLHKPDAATRVLASA